MLELLLVKIIDLFTAATTNNKLLITTISRSHKLTAMSALQNVGELTYRLDKLVERMRTSIKFVNLNTLTIATITLDGGLAVGAKQIDLNLVFSTEDPLKNLTEQVIADMFKVVFGVSIDTAGIFRNQRCTRAIVKITLSGNYSASTNVNAYTYDDIFSWAYLFVVFLQYSQQLTSRFFACYPTTPYKKLMWESGWPVNCIDVTCNNILTENNKLLDDRFVGNCNLSASLSGNIVTADFGSSGTSAPKKINVNLDQSIRFRG